MMLESSLGKILATKPVEPSISKEAVVVPATKSEAEVRIVFRFFVEEQIVFNGKIEKVKQLESEEVSRIVSRIAWDGAKDEKKPLVDNGIMKNDQAVNCHKDDSQDEDRSRATDNAKSAQGTSASSGADSRGQSEGTKEVVDMDCSSSDTDDFAKGQVSPERGATSSNQSPTPSDFPTTLKSDNHTTAPRSKHLSEAEPRFDSSYEVDIVQEQKHHDHEHQHVEQEQVINSAPLDTREAEEAAAENRMIFETLYDCVNNVDLESRKSDQKSVFDTKQPAGEGAVETIVDGYTKKSGGEHNDQPSDFMKETARLDKKPLKEAANVPSNNDANQITNSNLEETFFREKDAHTHQASKDDLSLRLDNNKKTELHATSRRRNTSDNVTSCRRVRRTGAKDQGVARILTSDKLSENAHERQTSDRSVGLIHVGENLVRQTKVFAKWSDNHFYPGTILKSVKDRKFEIGFFDGARKDVAETDLIPLSNIIHKQVRVSIAKDYCVNALVHQKIANNGQPMFDVEYQQNGLVKKVVPLRDIFLTAEQGIPLINQPMRPDKNPDESMFAGVDLDNIVHVKRSRRLQEMEDLETTEETSTQSPNSLNGSRRKRGQYNMRNTTNRARVGTNKSEGSSERGSKKLHPNLSNQDTPVSSCSPDNLKPHLHSSNSNPPSESSSSAGSTNSASNVHEMGQEFYFESSSPHRTKTSLLL